MANVVPQWGATASLRDEERRFGFDGRGEKEQNGEMIPDENEPNSERDPPQHALDFLSPRSWIVAAKKAHPAFRFAIVVGGIAGIIWGFQKYGASLATLAFGVIVVIILMALFLVFAQATRLKKNQLSLPSIILVWTALGLTIASAMLLFTSSFFEFGPLPIRPWIVAHLANEKTNSTWAPTSGGLPPSTDVFPSNPPMQKSFRVVAMDSPLLAFGREGSNWNGRMNSADIKVALAQNKQLAVSTVPTSLKWDGSQEVKNLMPDLVIIHVSAFSDKTLDPTDVQHAEVMKKFINSMTNTAAKFLFYSRGLEFSSSAAAGNALVQIDRQREYLAKTLGCPKDRTFVFMFQTKGKKDFGDVEVQDDLRSQVNSILGL